MALKVGASAPAFTLIDSDRNQVSLSDYKGKNVVLAFFPAAFSGACDTEMCSFRDALAEFNSMNAEVLGISMDNPFAAKEFKNKHNLNFPLLSDVSGEVSQAYDSTIENFAGVQGFKASNRTVYLVDSNGTVQYVWQAERPPVQPPMEEVREAVKHLS